MNRSAIRFFFVVAMVLLALMPKVFSQSVIIPPANLEPPPWPEWVLRHWVWEHEEFTTDSALALARGYMERDISVGATIIDSAWETGFNTFEWNRTRYPDPQALIDALHALDVRVFLWITSMLNPEAPNYRYALEHNYLLNNGQTVRWWHGQGSFLDYTNPDAVTWWHGLMDNVLALGIDGWKTDGNDPLTYLLIIPVGYAGIVWPWQYSDYYYRDFYEYTRAQLGNDRVIMSRPVDSFEGLLHLPFAPRDVCHAGWVGDQDASFTGLQVALSNMFAAARMGYVNFGSDMAGYRGRGLRDRSLFLRWIQLGALCPIMENGGNGEHRPWMYDEDVLHIYRQFVKLHHELIPYLYSEGAAAYERGAPLMQPQSGIWQYLLGRSILVAPITEDATHRTITLPPGEWIDFWNGDVYRGASTVDYQVPLDRYPIFFRSGDIIPLHVVDGSLGHGDESSADFLTVLVNRPLQEASFNLYQEDSNGTTIRYRLDETALTFEVSATDQNFLFLLRGDRRPADIVVEPGGRLAEQADRDAFNAGDTGWLWDASRNELWIKPGPATYGLRIRLLSSRM